MDWIPDFLKGKLLQGIALGLLGGLVLFLALSSYEVRKFSALGFDIEIPNHNSADFDTLKVSLEKATAEAAQTASQLAGARKALEAREAELTAAMEALKAKDAEMEELKAQAKSKPADTNKANQSQTEIATLRKERDALAAQVKSLTAKLKSASDALADANKNGEDAQAVSESKSASACGVSTDGVYTVLSSNNASWELLGGKIKLRLKKISSLDTAIFYSNIADIDSRSFAKGADFRLKIDSCDYVLVVYEIDRAYGLVSIRFFAL